MGKIRGDVDAVGIANLLQMLSSGGCVGVLTVSRNLLRKSIQFGPAGMRLLSTGSKKSSPLGELLLRSGRITAPQLGDLVAEEKKSGLHLATLAVNRGLLSTEDLKQALQEQFAEELYELFTWKGASFEFTGMPGEAAAPGAPPPADLSLDSDATSVMLQASRLADELARIQQVIPDVQMVPVHLSAIPTASDDPRLAPDVLQGILPLIDGRRSIKNIIDESRSPRFLVLGTLYELVQRGMLEIRDVRGITSVRRRSVPVMDPPHRNCSILLLIDAADVLHSLGARLQSAGYKVRKGSAVGQLAEALGPGPLHAVVLDALTDSDEGMSRCGRLKAATSAPFICFSRGAGAEAVANAQRSGARYVLLMPIREDLLVERLAEIVRSAPGPG